jgi:succinate dehydrogenase/fumarate reductase flavoprotein subunit
VNIKTRKWDKDTEILIVGTGFAGLSAAIDAYDAGASVLLVDKMHVLGGNSIIAGGGVNAVDPERQNLHGLEDSLDLHFWQTLEAGDYLGEPEKIRFLVENALEMCLRWLEKMGVEWSCKVVMGYGALWERSHIGPKYGKFRAGAAIIRALIDQVEERKIPILLKHKVTGIVRDRPLEGEVLGVEVDHKGRRLCFRAQRAVILASGGFAQNLEMVADYDRRLANTPTTNNEAANGECIRIAQDIGAEVVHMDYIQCVPQTVRSPFKGMFFQITSKETRDFYTAEAPYTIFVDREGNRFVREDGRRDKAVSRALLLPLFEPFPIVEANSVQELEQKLAIPAGNLVATLSRYNCHCDTRFDSDFGKDPCCLIPCRTPPFRAETKSMARHYTMGGLKVLGTKGQVIDRHAKVIPRLFAAGEVTGGTHGKNRLGNNATAECIVFGRTIGRLAAREKLARL